MVRENREREREVGKGGECVDGKGVRGERGGEGEREEGIGKGRERSRKRERKKAER